MEFIEFAESIESVESSEFLFLKILDGFENL